MRHLPQTHRFYLHHYRGRLIDSIREIIFGLEDGLVSTLGVIVGIAAGSGSRYIVILSGFVVIAVEALSMSAGTYLSNKSEQELDTRFLEEEREEIRDFPEYEKDEARKILKRKGYTAEEQEVIMRRVSKSPQRLLQFMAHHELQLSRMRDRRSVVWSAIIMWCAYFVGGCIALLAFFILPIKFASVVAVLCVAVALFILGAVKGYVLSVPWLRSGFEMMTVSLLAAGIGQLVGWIIGRFVV